MTITKKTLESSDLENVTFTTDSFTYDGNEHKIEVSSLPAEFTVTYDDNTKVNVGSQLVTATITGTGNYTGTVTKTATLTVNPATINIVIDNKTVELHETAELTYTGDVPSGVIITLTRPDVETIGTYPIDATDDSDNYVLSYTPGEYKIVAKILTANDLATNFTDAIFNYDGTLKTLTATGLPENVTVTEYTTNTRTDIGEQTASATIACSGDYSCPNLVLEAKLKIVDGDISISDNIKKAVEPGEDITYIIKMNSNVSTNFPTYIVEVPSGLTLEVCPEHATCNENKTIIKWTPSASNKEFAYTATVDNNINIGSKLTTNVKIGSKTVKSSTKDVEKTVDIKINKTNSTTIDIVLTLDTSGSMWDKINGRKTKINELVEVTKNFVENLNDKNTSNSTINLTIVSFGRYKTDVTGWGGDWSPETLISGNLNDSTIETFNQKINSLDDTLGGGTQLYQALEMTTTKLKNSNANYKYAIILGDGAPDKYNKATMAVKNLKDIKAKIYTIGFDIEKNTEAQNVLKDISGNDNYYSASNSSNLNNAFDQIQALIPVIKTPQTEDGQFGNSSDITYTVSDVTELVLTYYDNSLGKTITVDVDLSSLPDYVLIKNNKFVWDISGDEYKGGNNFVMTIKLNNNNKTD